MVNGTPGKWGVTFSHQLLISNNKLPIADYVSLPNIPQELTGDESTISYLIPLPICSTNPGHKLEIKKKSKMKENLKSK